MPARLRHLPGGTAHSQSRQQRAGAQGPWKPLLHGRRKLLSSATSQCGGQQANCAWSLPFLFLTSTWRRGCQASLPPAAPGDSSWLPHFPHSCLWGWLGLLLWWTGSGEDRPGALHPDDPKRKSSSDDGAVGKCPGGQLGLRDTSAGQAQLKPLDSAQREAGTLSPPGLSLANSLWQMGHF